MSHRPRPTVADYVVIALSPALIMLLVGSLVFFLIEVFYQGDYDVRLSFIMAMFVMAAVLIARISIEESREYAMLFAIPLGAVTAIATIRFVEFSGPLKSFSTIINLGLIGFIWWCADRLTWDSTVIDESKDASGEGLLQTAGLDADATSQDAAAESQATQQAPQLNLWQRFMAYRRRPHSPGVWVIYFSLAALPIFGFGNWFIPGDDLGSRRYVFKLLVVYVAAALGLLLTTSFLNLRRYLRQRRLEMPVDMAGTWIGTGAAMIVALLLVCALLPRRNPEYSVTQLPMFAGSPTDLWTTEYAVGNEGQEDPEKADRTGDQKSESGEAQEKSDSDQKQSGESSKDGNSSQNKSDSGQQQDSKSQSSSQSQDQKSDSQSDSKQGSQSSSKSPQQKSGDQQNNSADKKSEGGEQSKQESQSDSPSSESGGKSQPSKDSKDKDKNGPQGKQGKKSDPNENGKSEPKESENAKNKSENAKAKSRPENSRKSSQPDKKQSQQAKTEPSKSPPQPQPKSKFDFSKIPNALGGTLGQLLKLLYWVAAFAIIGYFVWKYWRQIRDALANFWRSLQDFWNSLFGRKLVPGAESAVAAETAPPPVSFSSFHDPFLTGMAQSRPPVEVIRYSFEALEAWAREHGCARGPEQTPQEFVQLVGTQQVAVARDAATLAEMYNRCAYARDLGPRVNIEPLRRLWEQMRESTAA